MADLQLLDDQLRPLVPDQLQVSDRVYVNGILCRVAAIKQRDDIREVTFHTEPVAAR